MSSEHRQILDMLAAGTISPDEAEKLLEKIASGSDAESGSHDPGLEPASPAPGGRARYLRVVVDSTDGDKINVRVPMALIRTGLKLTTMLPPEASSKIAEHGIDLSQLGDLAGDELIEALQELTVDVDSSDGDKIKVFCE
jgi:hypothetical protein